MEPITKPSINPNPQPKTSIYRYDKHNGKLMGIEDVTDWTQEQIQSLVEFINMRPDNSHAVIKCGG